VDAQLAGKGMRRVESGGDLNVSYQGATSQEKQYDYRGYGPPLWGDARITTSTIDVGKLVVELFDSAAGHLVWRGSASKTLNIKKDPDKNYRKLDKAMAMVFKNYPGAAGTR
jgi:hypothetical protein